MTVSYEKSLCPQIPCVPSIHPSICVDLDKKDFLSNQCKEKEENNRMGKTKDLFKKIRDTKGTIMQKWAQ